MYEYLGEIKKMHVMELPQTSRGEKAFSLWRSEMIRLKERLEREFDVEITEDKLKNAIKIRNIGRTRIKKFYELGKLVPPPASGLDLLNVLYGSGFKIDKAAKNKNWRFYRGALIRDIKRSNFKQQTRT